MTIARFLLRATVGGLFVAHGLQKLKGWFGGHGLDATANMFETLGLRPGRRHAIAAAATETGAGTAVVLGAATPFAAAGLIAVMLTAIHRVHFKNGPWNTNQGYEFNLTLICAAALLAEVGPGALSVDRMLGVEKSGPGWGLAALALGGAGAYAANQVANAAPSAQPAPQHAEAATAAASTPSETPIQSEAARPEVASR